MKKLILLFICLISCTEEKVQPLDVYKNKAIVVLEEPWQSGPAWRKNSSVRCKTKDSVFNILIPQFDAKDLKPGDTIK